MDQRYGPGRNSSCARESPRTSTSSIEPVLWKCPSKCSRSSSVIPEVVARAETCTIINSIGAEIALLAYAPDRRSLPESASRNCKESYGSQRRCTSNNLNITIYRDSSGTCCGPCPDVRYP